MRTFLYVHYGEILLDNAIILAQRFVEISKDDSKLFIIAGNLSFLPGTMPGSRITAHFLTLLWVLMTKPVCELVVQFIFHQLSKLAGVKYIGFYRDDGGHPKKRFGSYLRAYKEKDYKAISPALTAKTNLVKTNFLDIIFNLKFQNFI